MEQSGCGVCASISKKVEGVIVKGVGPLIGNHKDQLQFLLNDSIYLLKELLGIYACASKRDATKQHEEAQQA